MCAKTLPLFCGVITLRHLLPSPPPRYEGEDVSTACSKRLRLEQKELLKLRPEEQQAQS